MFAFTQVATLLSDDPTFAGIGRGVLVLGALWWAWTAYAWLTNAGLAGQRRGEAGAELPGRSPGTAGGHDPHSP